MTQLINYSEFNTLTDCERKFVYAYLLGEEEQGAKRGLHLGTLCHLWHGRWLLGMGATLPEVWTDDINTGGKPGEQRTLSLSDFDPELVRRALWLAERFTKHYGSAPPSSWHVISAEEWMTREFAWGTLVGRTDGFVEIDGQLWLIELKTYGSRPGPLAWAQVSPQLGCYSLLAEAKYGQRPFGILYQGVYTYQWKPTKPTQQQLIDERPGPAFNTKTAARDWARAELERHPGVERSVEESFDQCEVELGSDHLVTAQLYLEAAVARRRVLVAEPHQALPAVGSHCGYCGFKAQCWNELGGVEEFEIELEDDDDEPA